jgi:YihY family inner membrane protein
MVLLVGIMMVGSFWAAYLPEIIERYPPFAEQFPATAAFAGSAVGYLTPIVFMSVGLTAIYMYLPDEKVPLGLAVKGGVTAALLWEVAKAVFAGYVKGYSNFGGVYGPLAAAIVFLLWVYFSASIVLFVAQVVSMKLRGEIA